MRMKRLTITEDAYDRLRALKRTDESFTDVILRLTTETQDPMDGFGAMRDVEGFKEAVEAAGPDLDGDIRYRHDR